MNETMWLKQPNKAGYWWHYGNTWTRSMYKPTLSLYKVIMSQTSGGEPDDDKPIMSLGIYYGLFVVTLENRRIPCDGKWSMFWGKWKNSEISEPELPSVINPLDLYTELP